jgi:hypothetical protein
VYEHAKILDDLGAPQAVAVAVEADCGRAYEAMLQEVERLERTREQERLLGSERSLMAAE